MIVCHCNRITLKQIEDVIVDFLEEDRWQLIVPAKVYHAMARRGRCCGCFPNVAETIVRVSEAYHRKTDSTESQIVDFVVRLRDLHQHSGRGAHEGRRTGHRAA